MMKVLCFLRALVLPVLIVLLTVSLSLVLFVGLALGGTPRFADFIIRTLWSRALLFVAGVRVKIVGGENLPEASGFLYLFTHSSYYDIPVLFGWAPRSFRFGAKAELFKVPFFGWAMAAVGTLKIARNDRQHVMNVYKKAEERVLSGEAFALSPEGGRRVGSDIAPFKTGPFIFAINANMPLVPAVIWGADTVLPRGEWLINRHQWRTTVVLEFLPPQSVEGFSTETAKVLREQVRESVVRSYDRLRLTT